jgi:thiol-disulfide isomerase/thioredoxin
MDAEEPMDGPLLPVSWRLPRFTGATAWLNSEPVEPEDLRGHVVAVDFWTFTCINWIRTLPYLRAWAETYRSHGLVVVGVHTPEFSIEHDIVNVRRAANALHVEYPIAIDNRYAVWDAFANQYWPALYLADAEGRIRYEHFGEVDYERSERVLRHLLIDAGAVDLPERPVAVDARGIDAPADWPNLRSPETYVGLARAYGFASPGGGKLDQASVYTAPACLRINEWALQGNWTIGREAAVANEPSDLITHRFHARDLNLILAPPAEDSPVRFRARLDGEPPGDAHGLDVDPDGIGIVREPRLYQLIRQRAPIEDRVFALELLDAGAAAYCFTFG